MYNVPCTSHHNVVWIGTQFVDNLTDVCMHRVLLHDIVVSLNIPNVACIAVPQFFPA